MENRLDIVDRLHGIIDEMQGLSDILFFIYEKEIYGGSEDFANAFLTLSKTVERYSEDLNEIIETV